MIWLTEYFIFHDCCRMNMQVLIWKLRRLSKWVNTKMPESLHPDPMYGLLLTSYNLTFYEPAYNVFACSFWQCHNPFLLNARAYMSLMTTTMFIQEQITVRRCLKAHLFRLLKEAGSLCWKSKSTPLLQKQQPSNTQSHTKRFSGYVLIQFWIIH